MLLATVIFLGINNIFLIYLGHYSLEQIIKRRVVISLVLTIFGLFCLSLIFHPIKTFFEIKDIAFIDFVITFGFSLIGSIIIAFVLKRFHLLFEDKINQDSEATLQ